MNIMRNRTQIMQIVTSRDARRTT